MIYRILKVLVVDWAREQGIKKIEMMIINSNQTRLETRTKESNMYANWKVKNL